MELLFDNFYRDGGKILAILAVGKLFNIATGMRGYVLMLTGHGYIQMYLTIFLGIMNIVFCIVGIKLFGILGVALGRNPCYDISMHFRNHLCKKEK